MNDLFDEKLTHFDLCRITAEHFLSNYHVILYEYQSTVSCEHPDVLCFKNDSVLFEIKMSRQDFVKDFKKECRIEKQIKYFPEYRFRRCNIEKEIKNIHWKTYGIEEFFQQKPHLGKERFYVCEKDLIKKEEIKNGFGLYYYHEGKFRKQKDSKRFKRNLYLENKLLSHAFRKYASGNTDNILIKTFPLNSFK